MSEQAKRDQNRVTTMLFVGSDGGTYNAQGDENTGRLKVDSAAGSGTVTEVSVVTANGFAGTVADSTTTPAITLTTTVTGILKGNGTAMSAAVAATDYVAPGAVITSGLTMATDRLLGRDTASSGAIEEITIGSGLQLSGGELSATGGGGTPGGNNTEVQYNDNGAFGGITGATTDGTALTLVAPILGTPASGTLTNCTGLPISTGVSGLGANVATFLATPSSANLAAAVTDETGSGALVFGTSPTITTPTISGTALLSEGASIGLDPALSADGTFSGVSVTGTAGAALAFGDVIYLAAADSRWELADASSVTTGAQVMIGMCVQAAAADGDSTRILLFGNVRADAVFPSFTISAPIFLSETAGDTTQTAPTTTDSVTIVLGKALTADSMFFISPMDWLTHT